ncbi:hypothetical protein EYF80_065895 [Liparis tanakae]|uniref:Uncharacterized protein n=1 Tax=Liparis tanakae TaxID=230148 RepID=A0A4Z2E6L7_9TELE|nr:hypothetical protein EYF80_065895 [Liparis tanakae]
MESHKVLLQRGGESLYWADEQALGTKCGAARSELSARIDPKGIEVSIGRKTRRRGGEEARRRGCEKRPSHSTPRRHENIRPRQM